MRLISRSGAALAALGLLCGAAALPTLTEASKLNLNGSTKCSSIDGGLTMDPAGNITITCTEDNGAGGGGGNNAVPVCNPSASPGTFVSSPTGSNTITFTANCTGSPTSYQWGNSPLSPPITPASSGATGFTVFGPNSPAGTYTFYVTATNANGTSAQATLNYVVTAAGSVACVGGTVVGNSCTCPAAQSLVGGVCTPNSGGTSCSGNVDSFSYTGQFKDFNVLKGGAASFRLPNITLSNRHAEMIAFQSTATPSDLQSEVAISSNCGSFDVDPVCKQSGSSWSSIDLYAFSTNMGYCVLTPGTTYYVNVRNVVNGVDSCKSSSCAQRLQYIGDLQ
jgi:hypothetical protein